MGHPEDKDSESESELSSLNFASQSTPFKALEKPTLSRTPGQAMASESVEDDLGQLHYKRGSSSCAIGLRDGSKFSIVLLSCTKSPCISQFWLLACKFNIAKNASSIEWRSAKNYQSPASKTPSVLEAGGQT